MEEIFLCYRRSDSEGQARSLFRDLEASFGPKAVLPDVAGLEKGRDFRKTIESRLKTCKVLLVLIARSWLDAKDEAGLRRLDNENDIVRSEIAAALQRDIPVIPVLVGGAAMPRAIDLPNDLGILRSETVLNLAMRVGIPTCKYLSARSKPSCKGFRKFHLRKRAVPGTHRQRCRDHGSD